MYIASNLANSGSKTQPAGLPASAFSSLRNPTPNVLLKRPNHVIVNGTGSFSFLTTWPGGTFTEGSVHETNANYTSTYTLTDKNNNAKPGSTRLDIQPLAWSSGSAVKHFKGDVTFVYKGGL